MASTRTTFTMSEALAYRARSLNINISDAARRGVAQAVSDALAAGDRVAYERHPESPDEFWDDAEAWVSE